MLCGAELQHQKPFSRSFLQRLQPHFCVCKVPVKHKYGAVVLCKVSVKFSGAEDLRLLSCTFTFTGGNSRAGLMTAGNAEPILLMHLMPDAAHINKKRNIAAASDINGKILYSSVMFEAALHYPFGELHLMCMPHSPLDILCFSLLPLSSSRDR